ncbi:uncharacterized protein LOC124932453 [Impatiens glandulifera]|uniref:uncharacterized protein LOC124932453 n=1 Tax=Impatiens glandulifera TaxID=253017 RepID=UPI001FB0B892|nr:uncharacterized protein LOC124932453 [Impatiens glandulifera]
MATLPLPMTTVMPLSRRPELNPSFSIHKLCKKPKSRSIFKNPINSITPLFLFARGNPNEPIRGRNKTTDVSLIGAGLILTTLMATPVYSAESNFLLLNEPSNALSIPTWAIHISCVIEWITAMVLVWEYGEKSGNESWKGLSWGMVPLLGGALCCCTWHFFYNNESLEVLVTLQGALTVIGNGTLCLAAFRIYSSSQEQSKKL